jgi:hypothetical protein
MSGGVLVAFETEDALSEALKVLKSAEAGAITTYTPKPIEQRYTIIPVVILAAGVLGFIASFGLQTYANVFAYPIDIGGRPGLSWPAFVPIAFENGILTAVLAGFFGYLIANRMPRLYEPVDECRAMRRAVRDLYCVAVQTEDPDRVRDVLRGHRFVSIEEFGL